MQVQQNYNLKKHNTFGIDIYAKEFSEFSNKEVLNEILDSQKSNSNILILGGGSNLLFTQNYDGHVLKNSVQGISVISENVDFVYIKAGAGVIWHELVMYCVDLNYGGIENLSLIPGNVGASPMQNIGAYGVEIKDVFHELEAFHLKEKTSHIFSAADCEFGYRESVFKKKYQNQYAILNVTFCLRKKPLLNISYGAIEAELKNSNISEPDIKSVSDAIIKIRTSKLPDPNKIGNAGSFFKNPVVSKNMLNEIAVKNSLPTESIPNFPIDDERIKIPAGWLIEQCGWKGYRKGDAGCYDKQALVLVNYGNATGREIYNLSTAIKESVFQKFEIELEREVNVV